MITWSCDDLYGNHDDIHLPSNDDIYGNHDNGFPGILGRPMCLWPPPLTAMGFPTVRESGFPRGGSSNKKANIRKWGVISRHWVPVTGNPELCTHVVMERGKRCVKFAQNVRGGFQCHRVQIGFLDFCPAVRRLVLLVPLPL